MPSAIDIALGRDKRPSHRQLPLDGFFTDGAPTRRASVSTVEPQALVDAIDAWTSAGGLISFSLTSDGGALSISLRLGDWQRKLYASAPDEVQNRIESVIEASKALDGQPGN